MKKIRIGGGQGFWGDSNDAAYHMIREGELDYMGADYIAELTMSIMQKQKNRNPEAGFARDFIGMFENIGKEAFERGTKIITNAGGVNVAGAVKKIEAIAQEQNLTGLRIGYVLGDDLLENFDQLIDDGIKFDNLDTGEGIEKIRDRILNVNVYYGSDPIIGCLEDKADLVINGRAADSALFLAPLKHEFGWASDDWDNLARGIMVGHLLECGGQGSGGNFDYDWRSVPDMDQLGFPIAEITDDRLYITKAPNCGGMITEQVCKEQFLYEVHDPANYLVPDVNVDISRATITQAGKDRVEIGNIRGKSRPELLKLCVGYSAGYKVETYLSFAWPDAYEKAQYAADIIMKKMARKGLKTEDIRIDYLGVNALHLDVAEIDPEGIKDINECVLRIAIRTLDKDEAKKLIPEISPLQLNGPPGASFFGGRARIQDVIGLWPTMIPRECVHMESHVLEVK